MKSNILLLWSHNKINQTILISTKRTIHFAYILIFLALQDDQRIDWTDLPESQKVYRDKTTLKYPWLSIVKSKLFRVPAKWVKQNSLSCISEKSSQWTMHLILQATFSPLDPIPLIYFHSTSNNNLLSCSVSLWKILSSHCASSIHLWISTRKQVNPNEYTEFPSHPTLTSEVLVTPHIIVLNVDSLTQ